MSIESIEARLAKALEPNSYTAVRMELWAHLDQDIPLLLAVAKAAVKLVRITGRCAVEYEDEIPPCLYPALDAMNAALADLAEGE